MKFIFRLLLITGLGYFIPMYTPWWTLFIISFLVGYLIHGNGFNIFNAGLLSGGLIWMGLAFKINQETQGLLTNKMVNLMPAIISDANLLIIFTSIIGALCAGFSALTGNSLRQIFIKKKDNIISI